MVRSLAYRTFHLRWADPAYAFFQLSFAATAATIDSGALAERCDIWAYLIVSALTTAVYYPIVAHWSWSETGWLNQLGFRDFAGGMVVHGFGGVSALVSAPTLILSF